MSSSVECPALFSCETTGTDEYSLLSSQKATTETPGSNGGFVPLREFLDKFPLPRVVRIEDGGSRPILLYTQQPRSLRITATLLMHRYRHDIKVGPEIVIPEGYPGWFSVVTNNNHTSSARIYRKIGALVRAGVPAFLLAKPLRAYSLTHSKIENGNLRAHYTKTTVRAGEVLRLAAVFQDTRRALITTEVTSVTSDTSEMKNSRLSERDQYAQFLDSRGHELFVPLSSRCELYATCQSGSLDTESDAVLYRVHQLVNRELPLRVRLIAGPLPIPLPRNYNGLMQFENATHGPIVLGCAIPMIPERAITTVATPELLELVTTGPGAPRVKRVRLGFPSESRLLGSPKMQRLLSACRRALDQRATEPRIAPLKLVNSDNHPKELHLKEIKSQLEAKPLLQSLKDSLEHMKKTTICDHSYSKSSGNSSNPSFLERLSKITHSNKSRNPAKKSASFTFAVRPEIGMKVSDPYGSLESDTNALTSNFYNDNAQRQLVYRSISTSALEIQKKTGSNFPYSKVRDSLTQLPSASPLKVEDIYTEICDPSDIGSKENFCRSSKVNSSLSKVCINRKNRGYIKLATHSEVSNVSSTTIEEENIYNTVS